METNSFLILYKLSDNPKLVTWSYTTEKEFKADPILVKPKNEFVKDELKPLAVPRGNDPLLNA